MKRRLLKIFPSNEKSSLNEKFLYVGAGQLKRAYDSRDELAVRKSFEMVRPWVPSISGQLKLGAFHGDDWPGVRRIYSSLMSNLLQDSRLLLWCSDKEKRFLPGVYCPHWKTAAFVTMSMGRIRVCQKCDQPFVPKSDNQDYCTPAHGVAYRTALSRWRKKTKCKGQIRVEF